MIPLGVGIGLVVAALIGLEWEYGYLIPYTYCPYNFFELRKVAGMGPQGANVHLWALGYFAFFTILSYVLYITKKEKG